jgi:hypothetical protein
MLTPALVLRSAILKLPSIAPIADRWPAPPHSSSHRYHWLGWLSEYDGPGYYNRTVPKEPRSMAYIYTHIHCAPMLLWLAEVAGVRNAQVREADRALRDLVQLGLPNSSPRCGITVCTIIPWRDVEAALIEAGYLNEDASAR